MRKINEKSAYWQQDGCQCRNPCIGNMEHPPVSYSRIISILPMSRLAEIRSGMRDERSTWQVTG